MNFTSPEWPLSRVLWVWGPSVAAACMAAAIYFMAVEIRKDEVLPGTVPCKESRR